MAFQRSSCRRSRGPTSRITWRASLGVRGASRFARRRSRARRRRPRLVGRRARHSPCAARLAPRFGCPLFGATPARFDLLAARRRAPCRASAGAALSNTEDNQPPLFYLLAGPRPAALARARAGALAALPRPAALLGVALRGAVALFGPLRRLGAAIRPAGARRRRAAPPADSGRVRGARALPPTTRAVFLWAALVRRWPLEPSAPIRAGAAGGALLAARPAAEADGAARRRLFAVAALVRRRRRTPARRLAGAAAGRSPSSRSRLLRGWRWGGTLEFNRAAPPRSGGSFRDTLVGLARSAYTFVKTTFWVGELELLPRAAAARRRVSPAPRRRAARSRGRRPIRAIGPRRAPWPRRGGFLAFAVAIASTTALRARLVRLDWLPWLALDAPSDLARSRPPDVARGRSRRSRLSRRARGSRSLRLCTRTPCGSRSRGSRTGAI